MPFHLNHNKLILKEVAMRIWKIVLALSMAAGTALGQIGEHTLVASYPLTTDSLDETGKNGPITLDNAPFADGGVFSNGIYIYAWVPDFCLIETPQLNALDFGLFAISVEFKVSARPPSSPWPVFVGGKHSRWIGYNLSSDGTVALLYNNDKSISSTQEFSLNVWHTATIVYSMATESCWFYLDSQLAGTATFALIELGDKTISNTNFSNGMVFHGWMRNLKVYRDLKLDAPSSLVQNPGFESGTAPWQFFTNGTGSFSDIGPGGGSPHAAVIQIGGQGTNVQLYQAGIPIRADAHYRLSFQAYSTTGHNLKVYVHKHGVPYSNYGLTDWSCDLTEAWKRFSMEFRTMNFSGTVNDARIRFWFADNAVAGDRYYIDNVILEDVEAVPPEHSQELVINGGFEADGGSWRFYTNGSGFFETGPPGDGSAAGARVKVTAAGTNVQLFQSQLKLEADAWYTLRFSAYSKSGHDLSVSLHKHGAPYTSYGLSDRALPLKTFWTACSVVFQASGFAGIVDDGRLRFWLAPYATAGDEYFFDNVSLIKTQTQEGPAKGSVVLASESLHPTENALAQNYPNPFNPVTNIRFTLATRQLTLLRVFDVTGREIATLVNDVVEPGIHAVRFDASALPSGVYFYRMQTGDFVQTRKLLLVR
jgi:hypothetical protein